jgi:hypothetical protein
MKALGKRSTTKKLGKYFEKNHEKIPESLKIWQKLQEFFNPKNLRTRVIYPSGLDAIEKKLRFLTYLICQWIQKANM